MTVQITIDGHPAQVDEQATVLQAARQLGITIPTLCDYPTLTPHASCRLCIVEIEGTSRTPTSCTTRVEAGMSVRTDSPRLRAMRSELLRLLLSEHPLSCIICPERGHCDECMATLRKAGITTGCRSCTKEGNCEFLQVVDSIGLGDTIHPMHYRFLPVERMDPFFERDYNLCVHCGRCIRICEGQYFTGTLTFTSRGTGALVGTAFGRSHVDSGCSFCGSCVEVCPTGTLAEKMRKWDGAPEQDIATTCPLCGLACSMRLLTRQENVMGSLPVGLPGDAHLCVKGRFGITELVSHPDRLRSPRRRIDGRFVSQTWDEAAAHAAGVLAACPPDRFEMRLAADLSTEDLYVAQKFARVAVGSNRVRCSAAETYGAAINGMVRTLKAAASPAALAEADAILCVGLNTRYAQSIVESELVRAQRRGAKIFAIHPDWHSLSLHADRWLQPAPNELPGLLDSLARTAGGEPATPSDGRAPAIAAQVRELAADLRAAGRPAIVLGAETLTHPDAAALLESVEALARSTGATVVPLVPEGNLIGTFLAGVYPDLRPGGVAGDAGQPTDVDPQVLYLIGVDPPADSPATVIYQNIDAPPDDRRVDLILSTSAFSEAEGTLVDLDRRVREMHPAVPPPGDSLPTWEILCRIARAMGAQGFDFAGVADIQAEMAIHIDGYRPGATLSLDRLTPAFGAAPPAPHPAGRDSWPFILTARVTPHTYLGIPLSRRVAGMRDILPEDALSIHPEDASGAGIAAGDSVIVRTPHFERTWPVRLDPDLQPGTLLITLRRRDGVGAVITPAEIRTAHVSAD